MPLGECVLALELSKPRIKQCSVLMKPLIQLALLCDSSS